MNSPGRFTNIALLQMAAHGRDLTSNIATGERYCRLAAAMGADIALFPEMWNTGYSFFNPAEQSQREQWAELAVGTDSDYVLGFRALAHELNMAIALTYLERWHGAPRNTVSLIDRHGNLCLTYAKVHTCDWDAESALTPGDDFYVCGLDTENGTIQVGAMICYDREFPESARILMLKGAEIILVPNACGLERHRLDQFKTRAYENMLGVAMANYAAPQQNGHSVAYDGVAFDHEEHSRDMLIVEAGETEGLYMARFDLDSLRAYRQREVWGDAFRHPSRYRALSAPDIHAPFERTSARR